MAQEVLYRYRHALDNTNAPAMAILTMTKIHCEISGQTTTCMAVTKRFISASGKRNFQASPISWSIRTRGSVVLVHTITKKTMNVFIMNQSHGGSKGPRQPLKKRVVMRADMAIA